MMELLQRYIDLCAMRYGTHPHEIVIPKEYWNHFVNSWPYTCYPSPSVIFGYTFNGIPIRREQ